MKTLKESINKMFEDDEVPPEATGEETPPPAEEPEKTDDADAAALDQLLPDEGGEGEDSEVPMVELAVKSGRLLRATTVENPGIFTVAFEAEDSDKATPVCPTGEELTEFFAAESVVEFVTSVCTPKE